MPVKLFISQNAIDTWIASDRVDMSASVLSLRDGRGALVLAAAFLFRKVSAGNDNNRLLGKVKTETAIAALGGEAYMTSVIVGETAYEVEPGFMGTPAPGTDGRVLVQAVRSLGA
jgi:hypothetical protein